MWLYYMYFVCGNISYTVTSQVLDEDRGYDNVLPAQGYRPPQNAVLVGASAESESLSTCNVILAARFLVDGASI
jgi:hypothetical protein